MLTSQCMKQIFPPVIKAASFLLPYFCQIKLKAKSSPVQRRSSWKHSARIEPPNKFAASFHLVTTLLSALPYLWPLSHIMLLLFSLYSSYPVWLCLLALIQPTQVKFSLDLSGSNINWKTATLAMAWWPHFSAFISQGPESKRPTRFYCQPKDKSTSGLRKRLTSKRLCGKQQKAMEFFCSGNKKLKILDY